MIRGWFRGRAVGAVPEIDGLIIEGRSKLAAATNTPWKVHFHIHLERGCRCLSCYDGATVFLTSNMLGCDDVPVPEGLDQERCDHSGYSYEDVELIVWMRNNLPRLLDELETLREAAR